MLRRCTPRNDAEGNNIAFKGLDVVCQYASKFFETAESGVDKVVSSCVKNPSVHWRYINFLRQRKTALDAPLYAVSAGRSMIEMLGVLAIIAVLTVGGIAGYSKAMKKYQANKIVGEITQVLVNLKEVSEHYNERHNWYNIYNLDEETKKALGLCLPSAKNCSNYQSTPLGSVLMSGAGQDGGITLSDADPELCISVFNNIVIPLKGNITSVWARTYIKDPEAESKKMEECMNKCFEQMEHGHGFNLSKCMDKCKVDMGEIEVDICMAKTKGGCYPGMQYLNIDDARVMTEFNALFNSGFDKKCKLEIDFKEGFFK